MLSIIFSLTVEVINSYCFFKVILSISLRILVIVFIEYGFSFIFKNKFSRLLKFFLSKSSGKVNFISLKKNFFPEFIL